LGGSPIEQAWRAHRSYLVNLAYAMLRDVGAAEDAVQEAFARLAAADVEQIRDLRGWLIVVTSRICLDQVDSARARRERPSEPVTIDTLTSGGAGAGGAAPDPAAPGRAGPDVDPADRVTLDDEVHLALLVVLQRLTPAERVAFVLHDVFGLPYDTVAGAMGRTVTSCRQLAHRARLAVRAERPAGADVDGAEIDGAERRLAAGVDRAERPAGAEVDGAERRLVTERFLAACANGDVDGLVAVLAPDVHGTVDLGPADRRSGTVVHGAPSVARNLLRYFGSWTTLVEIPAAGDGVVLLAFVARRLNAVIALGTTEATVADIHVTADPAKLGPLAAIV